MKRLLAFILIAITILSLTPTSTSAAATYSIVMSKPNTPLRATACDDDTCNEDEVLYFIDFDVSGRGTGQSNAVTVDIYISSDTNIDWSTATMTATGTFYTTSYVPSPGWWCTKQVSTQMLCAAKIDDDTNARITLRGRKDAPYECANDTQDPSTVPVHIRYPQADLYKHTDPTKSATDIYDDYISCHNGNDDYYDIHAQYLLYTNGGTPPNIYYKPAGTAFKVVTLQFYELNNTVPGPLTYKIDFTTPSWFVMTSCPIVNNGSALISPNNPTACTITNSGHRAQATFTFDSSVALNFDFYGTLGSIPECPSTNTFTKNIFDQAWIYRNHDGAWDGWGNLQYYFKCQ